jgi:hypothetical protein
MLKIRSIRLDAEKDWNLAGPPKRTRADSELEHSCGNGTSTRPAILERAQRRDEPRRAAPGTPGVDSKL